MTDPVLTIEPDRVSVEPGGQSRVVVTIANPGTIVEGFRIDVVDEVSGRAGGVEGPSKWSEVIPPDGTSRNPDGSVVVSVYPQQRQSVVVVFSPPSGPHTPGGVSAFGVRVVSVVDPSASAVVEGDVEIGRVFGLQAKLVPVTSSGRWRGGHVVQLSNWGNAPARLRLVASDPDQALGFLVRPEIVDLPLGGTVSARISVRTRRPKLRGNVARLPFSVVGEPDVPHAIAAPASPVPTPDRPVVNGAFTQKPILSRAIVVGAALAGLGAVALIAIGLHGASAQQTFQELGVPPTPVMKAHGSGPEEIRLSWAPLSQIQGYKLLHLAPGSDAAEATDQLDKELGEFVVAKLTPATSYCFQLIAVRGDRKSPSSPKVCARTANATASGGSSSTSTSSATKGGTQGGGSQGASQGGSSPTTTSPTAPPTDGSPDPAQFAGGKWILMVSYLPAEAPWTEEKSRALQRQLEGANVQAKLLFSEGFPLMKPPLKASWVVYLGPYDSEGEALANCTRPTSVAPFPACQTARPSPTTGTQPSPTP